MWCEDTTYEDKGTGVIEEIKWYLAIYVSRAQKKMKDLTNLIMLDNILPAHFRIYREVTGDSSVSYNSHSKQCDQKW